MADIIINIGPILDFFNQPVDMILWRLFVLFGWMPLAYVFIKGGLEVWMFYIQYNWAGTQKKILLAIDIPRGNEQSPKAVEHIFSYLAGAHGSLNMIETYWDGAYQLSFSFEIVSVEGYTQFIIRTPESFRDLIETAVYSQYPDAEITEIRDYTEGMPKTFPDDEYDIAAADFKNVESDVYPLKTYIDFEHQYSAPGLQFKDPMATFMDLCSSLRKGEQLWYQIVVTPIEQKEFVTKAENEIKKISGTEKPAVSWFDKIRNEVYDALAFPVPPGPSSKEFSTLNLTPKQKNKIEGVNMKASKLVHKCKIRYIYIAKKDVMNKKKAQNGIIGYIKQHNSNELNSLKPDFKYTGISAHYFFKQARLNYKKNQIMANYVSRDGSAGVEQYVLNIEELATLWHFPIEAVVKAPLVQKAPGRKAEPPMSLPVDLTEEQIAEDVDEIFSETNSNQKDRRPSRDSEEAEIDIFSDDFTEQKNEEPASPTSPPGNLPFA